MGLSRMFFVSLSRAHARKNSNIFGFSLTETIGFTFLWKNLAKSIFSFTFAVNNAKANEYTTPSKT
jgi:hypothetical protein